MKKNRTLLIFLIAANFLLLQCKLLNSDDSDSSEVHLVHKQGDKGFIGVLEDTEASIAIVTGFEVAWVLVVNGNEMIFEWFEIDLPEDYELNLQRAEGSGINAKYQNDQYVGTISLSSGTTHQFTASVNNNEGAGMFLILKGDCTLDVEVGWVIDGSGLERGAIKINSRIVDAPKLTTDKITIDDTEYPIYRAGPPKGDHSTTAFPDVCKTPAPAGPVPIPYPG